MTANNCLLTTLKIRLSSRREGFPDLDTVKDRSRFSSLSVHATKGSLTETTATVTLATLTTKRIGRNEI
ncbi:hypothetical protein Y032_0793g2380 [Ancylostoma ceylanicum]|uniref:Uncharacterized protein n=1 Tax=Ancylostoma ceylanicum TaxID=53326 RepID=A0A016WC45_9BILA|nr:hypothetical protein Y032_0793g2380 [Ancylostoma ceylanicum]